MGRSSAAASGGAEKARVPSPPAVWPPGKPFHWQEWLPMPYLEKHLPQTKVVGDPSFWISEQFRWDAFGQREHPAAFWECLVWI